MPDEASFVREVAADPSRWPEARSAFERVRVLVLTNERRSPTAQTTDEILLYLAENVAKAVYR